MYHLVSVMKTLLLSMALVGFSASTSLAAFRYVDIVGTAYSKTSCAKMAETYLKRRGLRINYRDYYQYVPAPSNDCYAVYYE